LAQHATNPEASLTDSLDTFNHYIVARRNGAIAGFISITPPGGRLSIDKYFQRESLPFTVDAGTYEIRLLTVLRPERGRSLASLLMYAAFRWVEAQGGTRIVAIGRREILDLYVKAGLCPLGFQTQSGAVCYELMTATVTELRSAHTRRAALLDRLERACDWRLGIPFHPSGPCFHGGHFFEAIGDEFDALDRRHNVINADVLDAWFPPSPRVLSALSQNLEWIARTSPPTNCEGVIRAIARARGVDPSNILSGAGSSDLIYLALRQWLTPSSRALILDPTYGEYAHVLEHVVRCRVDRLPLTRADDYALDPARLLPLLDGRYDLIVLVNPNSPTGRHVPREALEPILAQSNPATRIWIDETYIEYTGPNQSLEPFATRTPNIIVCKSMSKVYALSGLRAAYLCASASQLESLRAISPPWAMSLPAQIAAVEALNDPAYYAQRYAETHLLRDRLATALRDHLDFDVFPGTANFLLCHLPEAGPDAATLTQACAQLNLFLRDAALMGTSLGTHAIRIAVKDGETNARLLVILQNVLDTCRNRVPEPVLRTECSEPKLPIAAPQSFITSHS
jgi:histidinol-phosphate/aromatic aminotransferase/cobyric acid decarboxylase-like protein/GNAT superfamily N-acetyltransferase